MVLPCSGPNIAGNGWYVQKMLTYSHMLSAVQVLESLLKEWHKDKTNKVLIFTKSVKLLEMIDFHLNAQGRSRKTV